MEALAFALAPRLLPGEGDEGLDLRRGAIGWSARADLFPNCLEQESFAVGLRAGESEASVEAQAVRVGADLRCTSRAGWSTRWQGAMSQSVLGRS